jgi:hypothetical protein
MIILNSTVASRVNCGSAVGAGLSEAEGAGSSIGSLLISDPQIEANGSDYGSGIGTGCCFNAISRIDNMMVLNSTVVSHASRGPGLGTGWFEEAGASASIGSLVIRNSGVATRGTKNGPGIGTSFEPAVIQRNVISNSSLIAISGPRCAAIRSGTPGSPVGLVHFLGDCFIECQANESPAAIQASSLLMKAASLCIISDDALLF